MLDIQKIDQLRELMGDSFKELINSYLENSKEKLDKLQNALDSMDSNELHQLAHGLKGSSGNIGASSMEELSTQIELLAKQGQLDGAQKIVSDLFSAFTQTQTELNRMLNIK